MATSRATSHAQEPSGRSPPSVMQRTRHSTNEHPAGAFELLIARSLGQHVPIALSPLQLSGTMVICLRSATAIEMLMMRFVGFAGFAPRHRSTLTSPHYGRAELIQLPSFPCHRSSYTPCAVTCCHITFARPSSSPWQKMKRAKPHWTDSKVECHNNFIRTQDGQCYPYPHHR